MVGIDIGSKSIKIIEINKSGNTWQLKSSGAVGFNGPTPDKITDDKDFEALANIVKKMTTQIGVGSKEVNISLPESIVFTRLIKFPLLSDEEVASAVKWEVEQYIPIPVNEAVTQYVLLERDEKLASTTVLLVAAPKVSVEKYVKVIRLAGLTPVSAETELTAMARSLAPDTGTFLILDLGSSATSMSVIKDGKILLTRSIPVAGEAFTRAVAQGLNINPNQAEEYKKTYGLQENQLEGKVKNALDPVFRMVVDEVKKSIHFYQSDTKNDPPSSVIITGGASAMPGVVPYLTEKLGIETILGDPFSKLGLDAETAKSLASYSSIYAVSVGLAMRED